MKLKLYPYFATILLLVIVLDLQFFYNVDIYQSRSIITFLVLTFIPGFLLYKLLHPIKTLTSKIICYSMGISVALIMLIGLVLNIVLYFQFSIIPLNKSVLLIFLNSLIFLLLVGNFIQDYISDIKDRMILFDEKFKIYDLFLFFLCTLFPLFSVLGTSMINNGGSNILSLINLGLIGLFILLVLLIKPDKISSGVFPYAIYCIGLSILFNISLRGWLITGSDIQTEYRMFQSTLTHGYWAASLQNHSYNACISITLLPAIYAILINLSPDYIFKFLFQIIFAFVPVIVYLYTRKFANNVYSFLAGILFVSFPIFVNAMSMHIRQEVAFLFFSLMILVLFEEKLRSRSRYVMLILFGFSMIISHYSTTFIALGLLTSWYFLDLGFWLFLTILQRITHKKMYKDKYKRIIPIIFIIILYLFSFYWYTKVVNIGGNLQRLEKKITGNLTNIFSNDVRVDQTSLANQFNIFYTPKNKSKLLQSYVNETNSLAAKNYSSSLYFPPNTYKDYQPVLIEPSILKLNIPTNYFRSVTLYMETIKKIQKILTILGVLILLYMYFTESNINKDLLLISLSSLFILLAFIIIPYFTIDYDILRTTQQLLIILSTSTLMGAVFMIQPLGEKIRYILVGLFIISYFFIYSNFLPEVIGGNAHAIHFHNTGVSFERFYIFESEKASINWLYKNKRKEYLIQSDPDSITRITMNTLGYVNTTPTMLPSTIYRSAYVYLNRMNTINGITYKNYQGEILRYTIPNKFFDQNKNLIYNNKSSKVYQ